MNRWLSSLISITLLGLLVYVLCPNAIDLITQPTAREVYARDFKKTDATYRKWKQASHQSLLDSSIITTPYSQSGLFSSEILKTYTFDLPLKRGEILTVEVSPQNDSTKVFIDLYKQTSDSLSKYLLKKQNKPFTNTISHPVSESGNFKVQIQPEIAANTAFQLKIFSEPQYAFPVAGKDNRAIQSLWGAPRGGGTRIHKGNDIFAARGTPVVAITNGIITSTGNRGLGGKQVWLRDGIFGQSLYYAHLDSIIAKQGQRVKVGDTLGLVGNTGNARTTPPHLHFGIYTKGGAIDPNPFIKISENIKNEKPFLSNYGVITARKTTILQSPSRKATILNTLQRNDSILIYGKSGAYFYVAAGDTLRGFIRARDLRDIN